MEQKSTEAVASSAPDTPLSAPDTPSSEKETSEVATDEVSTNLPDGEQTGKVEQPEEMFEDDLGGMVVD